MTTAKFATSDGTSRYVQRFLKKFVQNHFRQAQDLWLSSIGIGTYLGEANVPTDKSYTQAITNAVELGCNVIDTAANYRFQRSERAIGKALQNLRKKKYGRDEIVICTKGGYLPFENEPPNNVRQYFIENFVETGIADFEDIVGGSHCMTPSYMQSQIDQSLKNMEIEGIDVYYIHNPEAQLSEVKLAEFEERLASAFELLEENRAGGKIKFYGVATWNGFRVSPSQKGYHSLEKMANIARKVGGKNHGFKFIQIPFNLTMPEALVLKNQTLNGEVQSTVAVAHALDITVVASASISQGQLATGLPPNVSETLGKMETDAQTSLQFVRSAPGITTALVGMSRAGHVEENMKLGKIEPVSNETFMELFEEK
ncbi:MAG: aldo/keto reductase [Acidobacteria bacterium]|jgi:aryl-alcohol dehydrogenase-like predicted oxidoreductase|nr:aldo/keto reductase [Acidobacteriota bacterium]